MDKVISYCGLICETCPIYLATREQDEEKRYKMRVCKPEDVTDCDGCKAESGRLFSGSRNCEIRKCATGKDIENCAHCNQYACERIEKFFATDPDARVRLDAINKEF